MNMQFRLATEEDLPTIVELLLDDVLGKTRESGQEINIEKYKQAFVQIQNDSNQELTVAELDGAVVATFQLSFIPYLTYQGGTRCQVEAVRVHANLRGQGTGKLMFDYIINRSKGRGCHMIQLTTDKKRPDAIRFYENLGFKPSHEGMKLHL